MKQIEYEYIPVNVVVPDENPNYPKGFYKNDIRYIKVIKQDQKPFNFDDEEIII